jgi:6-phosphogluconolactonase
LYIALKFKIAKQMTITKAGAQRSIKWTVFLFFLIISSGCVAQKFYLFAGTYTETGSKGIYVYNFDADSGKSSWVSNTDSVVNPSYLTVSGNYVYAVNETNGKDPGRVSAFLFNKKTGKLLFINSRFSGGDDPCYVATSTDNKWLAVANYTGGNLSIFPINKNGSLKPYAQLIQHSGSSMNKERQEKAHVHETVFSPDYKYLLTPDLGMDKVMIYRFNSIGKKPLTLPLSSSVSTTPGSGPRHITFHPNKKWCYLIQEMSGMVNVYNYNNGKLDLAQEIATHPDDFKGNIDGAEIAVSADGKFLYTSSRGDQNWITIFRISPVTGKLTLKGFQSALGKGPRNFIMDPTGKYLLVANQNSDNIVIFKRNKQTGLLQKTGFEIKVPKPVCLKMISIK